MIILDKDQIFKVVFTMFLIACAIICGLILALVAPKPHGRINTTDNGKTGGIQIWNGEIRQ